jgi:hypothetical protein
LLPSQAIRLHTSRRRSTAKDPSPDSASRLALDGTNRRATKAGGRIRFALQGRPAFLTLAAHAGRASAAPYPTTRQAPVAGDLDAAEELLRSGHKETNWPFVENRGTK